MRRRVEIGTGLLGLLLVCGPAVAAKGHANGSGHGRAARGPAAHPPGYLGVGFHDASGHGVEVLLVDHDGPAGKAGLRPHDILVSLNGTAIANADALSKMIHETAPGVGVTLVVLRDGQTMKVSVTIADRMVVERTVRARVAQDTALEEADPPVEDFSAGDPPEPAAPTGKAANNRSFIGTVLHLAPFTGLALQTMEPQLAEFFGDSQGFGLLVQRVAPDSPAAFCGLRAGDVLLRANSVPLKKASDWEKRLKAAQGQSMALSVLRDHHEITVSLTPEARHHSMVEWPQMFEWQ
ncbi:PDZ domain-containing protein [Granulicella sp. 5B5]|uniref:PDZ domain-containing protein n=1 Tax=Granulicella sp. 5B5 TaxID=1617967 RepID=UPI0015F4A557|nr:PDZ domain-containing protein [Granulicella sp. 5B5]QMV18970.1 PDZ domain-containing protein [Granulicella sp. 5B5]